MTCIVGLVAGGTVYIGGDSAGVADPSALTIRADQKVFTSVLDLSTPMVFGFSSSFRMGQLLRYSLRLPMPASGSAPLNASPAEQLEAYMATVFVDAVRECLKAGGYARRVNEEESGGIFMVGLCGRLFTIESDYQVSIASDSFAAIGSGFAIALGSLYATEQVEPPLQPQERLLSALDAAEHFNAYVRRPFIIVSAPSSAPLA